MPADGLPDFTGGFLDAPSLRAIVDYLRRCMLKAAPGSGVVVRATEAGTTIALERSQGFFAHLTANSGSGAYAYARHPDAPGGGWGTATIASGTCYDADLNAAVTVPSVQWLEIVPGTSELRFKSGAC